MSNKLSEDEKSKAPKNGFSRWFRWLLPPIEGTVAEPWTTPKEFMENKDFQKKMKEVRKVIDKVKTNSK